MIFTTLIIGEVYYRLDSELYVARVSLHISGDVHCIAFTVYSSYIIDAVLKYVNVVENCIMLKSLKFSVSHFCRAKRNLVFIKMSSSCSAAA